MTIETQTSVSSARKGLFSLIVSGLSAAVSINAIMAWIHMAESTAMIDSGGPTFAANIGPMVNSFLGVVFGDLHF